MIEDKNGYRQRMLRALVYLEKRLDEPVGLEELAREAHFSPYHFHRIFTGMVGESVQAHIRRLKLERAAGMLVQTSRPVTDIALEAGYEAHAAFCRAFRALFSESPSSYRQSGRARLAAGSGPASPQAAGRAKERLARNQGEDFMKASIEFFPRTKVVFVRHVGPYKDCGEAWRKVCAYAARKGYFRPDALVVGLCHDDPEVTPPERIRYDACLALGDEVQPEGEAGVQEIGGGEYAMVEHEGPYENLHATYAALYGQWGPQSGREFAAAPSIEVYLNDPRNTPPEALRTKVYALLEPK